MIATATFFYGFGIALGTLTAVGAFFNACGACEAKARAVRANRIVAAMLLSVISAACFGVVAALA